MELDIGCKFCVASKAKELYGINVFPLTAGAFIEHRVRPAGLHPSKLDLANLKDPLTQELLTFSAIEKTYFFRDLFQMGMIERVLRAALDRKLDNRTARPQIKIWSAGCSTGQEPYSVAMLIRRRGWQELADFTILGTDIVARHLGQAALGKNYVIDSPDRPLEYPDDQEIPESYQVYVRPHGGLVDVKSEIRSMVDFRIANILDPRDYRGIENIDLVLVNNVFYHFGSESTQQALELLLPVLASKGVIISKDLHEGWNLDKDLPLKKLLFDDSLDFSVNGKTVTVANHRGYAAYQRSA